MKERWKPVVGYESLYSVSSFGRVKRTKAGSNTWPGRILSIALAGAGYPFVGLWDNNGKKQRYVHHLVAEAFIGPCPDGKQINHIDGVKVNDSVSNLEYVTQFENNMHALRNGLRIQPRGEEHYRAKLTEEDVHSIRRLLGKESQISIARCLNVSQGAISDIATGKRWAWLH